MGRLALLMPGDAAKPPRKAAAAKVGRPPINLTKFSVGTEANRSVI